MDKKEKQNCPFHVVQTAHIHCRKDHPVVMKHTVSDGLNDGYDKLQNSRAVSIIDGCGCSFSFLLPKSECKIALNGNLLSYIAEDGTHIWAHIHHT